MYLGPGQLMRERLRAVRHWPAWGYRRWLIAYIVGIVTVYGVAIAVAGAMVSLSVHDLILFGGLLLGSAGTVELTRRSGENAGFTSHIYGVWELPAAILLPPVFALTVPILRVTLCQLRVRRLPVQAGISQWAANLILLLPAVKGSDPTTRFRELLLTREVVQNDVAELCVAVLVTLAVAISALTIVFALPFVTLLQRSLRHNQLVNASRIDSKTGLLNAGTWEREAAAEVARAVRTRTPLALALVDIDHFKIVNDTFGHLVGDRALRSIARTFRLFLREYDLVGRFGGEEFALLLPHTMALDAYGIAERIRRHVASTALDVGNLPEGEQVRVTVSMGVAALGAPWDAGTQITDLLAAADRARYQAKRAGRDQVCVVTDNAVVKSPAHVSRLGQA